MRANTPPPPYESDAIHHGYGSIYSTVAQVAARQSKEIFCNVTLSKLFSNFNKMMHIQSNEAFMHK